MKPIRPDGTGVAIGTEDDDRIFGDDNDNTLTGLCGSDLIKGDGGDDTIFGDGIATAGAVGEGNSSTSTLTGGADIIEGGEGNDTMWGDGTADTVIGGADTFVLGPNSGQDIIKDFEDGKDILDVSACDITDLGDMLITGNATQTVIFLDGGTILGGSNTITQEGVDVGLIDASDFIVDVI